MINVVGIGGDARVRLLELVRDKLGFNKACIRLGISKPSMFRYLKGLRKIPDEVVESCLKLLDDEEIRRALTAVDRLKALGLIKGDGAIDYSSALEIIALASKDEYLKNALLSFVVKEFKEDLRRMLGAGISSVRLEWNEDFGNFLMERKRRRKVRTKGTLNYYRSIFAKHLEGKELSEQLIDFVVTHENKWLRNVFRHYIQYLFFRRKISPETFGWIMEVVPSRGYRLDVRPYQIDIADVREALDFLEKNHKLYYVIYRLMLESGARVSHVLRLLESWRPDDRIEVPSIDLVTDRLVVFEDRGFCRYYLGLGDAAKKCEWIYMSLNTLELVKSIAPRRIAEKVVPRYASKHGLIRPKLIRKVSWRLMIKCLEREVARFIQSRFGELQVSEARYEDLLEEADESYRRYLDLISREVLRSA